MGRLSLSWGVGWEGSYSWDWLAGEAESRVVLPLVSRSLLPVS